MLCSCCRGKISPWSAGLCAACNPNFTKTSKTSQPVIVCSHWK